MADTPQMPALPEPFIGVQDQPWGGHAEVIRGAIGEPGVISVYTAAQMHAFRAEGVREALERADADGRRYRAFFDAGLPITFEGVEYRTKADLDAAIDASQAEIQSPQKADTDGTA